jgi:2-polyprenyl-6-methoxyphenol hydroxylase-like FAD-dependent oxidoreductase
MYDDTTPLVDVLVVGAGPAGLTLACDLARRGKTIRVIDRFKEPPTSTRARGLSPRSLEIFENLGILEALSSYAEPALPWRIYDDNQHFQEMDMAATARASSEPTPDAPYRSFLQVSQRYTDAVLRDCLSSYERYVEWDCQLVAFQEHATHVEAEVLHAGKRIIMRARYLVGCDGGHSAVRKLAGISFEGSTRQEQPAILANVRISGISALHWHFWKSTRAESAWELALNPLVRQDTCFFYATNIPRDEHGALPEPTLETLQRLFDERAGIPGVHFSNLTWFSFHHQSIRLAGQFRRGRVFLAGDAAHVGITGGQGMNAAIQDAFNLSWKLALVLEGAPETLLDTYEAERQPIARSFLEITPAQPADRSASDGEQAMTRHLDLIAQLFQLSLSYRGSSLARDLAASTTLQAGDRGPDAPCTRATSGETVRIFDLWRGTHWTLLAFGEEPELTLPDAYQGLVRTFRIVRPGSEKAGDNDTLIDTDGHAFRAYGVSEHALILLRPDGHIGLTAASTTTAPVVDYLQSVTGR